MTRKTSQAIRSHASESTEESRNVASLRDPLTLGWHADQLHRLGAGLVPDLDRGRLVTTVSLVRRNGRMAFRRKRGR